MERVIRDIDHALRRLYRLETPLRPEEFLVQNPKGTPISERLLQAALLIRESCAEAEMELGLYFSPHLRKTLARLPSDPRHWAKEQLHAFTVAAEELSHFHYVVFNAQRNRKLTHLELELQAEVDKFVVLFFALRPPKLAISRKGFFAFVYREVFKEVRWQSDLSPERRETYQTAWELAGRFIRRLQPYFENSAGAAFEFSPLRSFYRLGGAEKLTLAAR